MSPLGSRSPYSARSTFAMFARTTSYRSVKNSRAGCSSVTLSPSSAEKVCTMPGRIALYSTSWPSRSSRSPVPGTASHWSRSAITATSSASLVGKWCSSPCWVSPTRSATAARLAPR